MAVSLQQVACVGKKHLPGQQVRGAEAKDTCRQGMKSLELSCISGLLAFPHDKVTHPAIC